MLSMTLEAEIAYVDSKLAVVFKTLPRTKALNATVRLRKLRRLLVQALLATAR